MKPWLFYVVLIVVKFLLLRWTRANGEKALAALPKNSTYGDLIKARFSSALPLMVSTTLLFVGMFCFFVGAYFLGPTVTARSVVSDYAACTSGPNCYGFDVDYANINGGDIHAFGSSNGNWFKRMMGETAPQFQVSHLDEKHVMFEGEYETNRNVFGAMVAVILVLLTYSIRCHVWMRQFSLGKPSGSIV